MYLDLLKSALQHWHKCKLTVTLQVFCVSAVLPILKGLNIFRPFKIGITALTQM